MSKRIVLASGNAGKLREFNAMMADLDIEFVRQSEFGVSRCGGRWPDLRRKRAD